MEKTLSMRYIDFITIIENNLLKEQLKDLESRAEPLMQAVGSKYPELKHYIKKVPSTYHMLSYCFETNNPVTMACSNVALQSAAYTIQKHLMPRVDKKVVEINSLAFNLFRYYNMFGLHTIDWKVQYSNKLTFNAKINLKFRQRVKLQQQFIPPQELGNWILGAIVCASDREIYQINSIKKPIYNKFQHHIVIHRMEEKCRVTRDDLGMVQDDNEREPKIMKLAQQSKSVYEWLRVALNTQIDRQNDDEKYLRKQRSLLKNMTARYLDAEHEYMDRVEDEENRDQELRQQFMDEVEANLQEHPLSEYNPITDAENTISMEIQNSNANISDQPIVNLGNDSGMAPELVQNQSGTLEWVQKPQRRNALLDKLKNPKMQVVTEEIVDNTQVSKRSRSQKTSPQKSPQRSQQTSKLVSPVKQTRQDTENPKSPQFKQTLQINGKDEQQTDQKAFKGAKLSVNKPNPVQKAQQIPQKQLSKDNLRHEETSLENSKSQISKQTNIQPFRKPPVQYDRRDQGQQKEYQSLKDGKNVEIPEKPSRQFVPSGSESENLSRSVSKSQIQEHKDTQVKRVRREVERPEQQYNQHYDTSEDSRTVKKPVKVVREERAPRQNQNKDQTSVLTSDESNIKAGPQKQKIPIRMRPDESSSYDESTEPQIYKKKVNDVVRPPRKERQHQDQQYRQYTDSEKSEKQETNKHIPHRQYQRTTSLNQLSPKADQKLPDFLERKKVRKSVTFQDPSLPEDEMVVKSKHRTVRLNPIYDHEIITNAKLNSIQQSISEQKKSDSLTTSQKRLSGKRTLASALNKARNAQREPQQMIITQEILEQSKRFNELASKILLDEHLSENETILVDEQPVVVPKTKYREIVQSDTKLKRSLSNPDVFYHLGADIKKLLFRANSAAIHVIKRHKHRKITDQEKYRTEKRVIEQETQIITEKYQDIFVESEQKKAENMQQIKEMQRAQSPKLNNPQQPIIPQQGFNIVNINPGVYGFNQSSSQLLTSDNVQDNVEESNTKPESVARSENVTSVSQKTLNVVELNTQLGNQLPQPQKQYVKPSFNQQKQNQMQNYVKQQQQLLSTTTTEHADAINKRNNAIIEQQVQDENADFPWVAPLPEHPLARQPLFKPEQITVVTLAAKDEQIIPEQPLINESMESNEVLKQSKHIFQQFDQLFESVGNANIEELVRERYMELLLKIQQEKEDDDDTEQISFFSKFQNYKPKETVKPKEAVQAEAAIKIKQDKTDLKKEELETGSGKIIFSSQLYQQQKEKKNEELKRRLQQRFKQQYMPKMPVIIPQKVLEYQVNEDKRALLQVTSGQKSGELLISRVMSPMPISVIDQKDKIVDILTKRGQQIDMELSLARRIVEWQGEK
ncbi:Conserved_hypothetical protein [Hexamita inflata]|uniref:Uncharacterized protein n=1 Tax=Hexamita inflata TaxID=28002 RepID=A0AA86RN53_9EUKA|nr:Conserved hypothetical protein [Hexamita inflata]